MRAKFKAREQLLKDTEIFMGKQLDENIKQLPKSIMFVLEGKNDIGDGVIDLELYVRDGAGIEYTENCSKMSFIEFDCDETRINDSVTFNFDTLRKWDKSGKVFHPMSLRDLLRQGESYIVGVRTTSLLGDEYKNLDNFGAFSNLNCVMMVEHEEEEVMHGVTFDFSNYKLESDVKMFEVRIEKNGKYSVATI